MIYDKFMTCNARSDHCPLSTEEWQHEAARFHSLDELLGFIASVLAEVSSTEQQ